MKKKLICLLVVLFALCSFVPVFAKGEEELENFRAGDSITLEQEIGATTFVAGNMVDVTSKIDGISFVAGNTVMMSNTQDYAFVAGNTITLTDFTAKDAFVAGSTITMKNANLRDLYVAGAAIKVDGEVSRNVWLAGESVIINAKVDGDVYVDAEKIEIGDKAVINGTLKYPKGVKPSISEEATVNNTKTFKSTSIKVKEVQEKTESTVKTTAVVSSIISWIISYLSYLVMSFVLLLIMKKFFDKVAKIGKKAGDIFKPMGIGLLTLIVTPIAAIIVMFTVVAIPVSIITLLLYGVLLYVSMIPTAYYLGNLFLKDKIKNKYLLMTVSLLVLYIVKTIPIIGGFVGFLALIFGLGVFTVYIKDTITTK